MPTATARRPPSVAATVAALDPTWEPPAPGPRPTSTPEAGPAADPITEARILDAILAGVVTVDTEAGTVSARGRELKTFSNRTDRRRFVRLHLDGKRRGIAVARVVWMAATGQLIPDGFEIHHDDKDPGNDAWGNLLCLHTLDHRKMHGQVDTAGDDVVPF